MSTLDGGPAFPSPWHPTREGYERGDCGMSLRDYFAGQALTGMCSGGTWPRGDDGDEIARRAYLFADAMLKARKA